MSAERDQPRLYLVAVSAPEIEPITSHIAAATWPATLFLSGASVILMGCSSALLIMAELLRGFGASVER